jgi:hypothetical protein
MVHVWCWSDRFPKQLVKKSNKLQDFEGESEVTYWTRIMEIAVKGHLFTG